MMSLDFHGHIRHSSINCKESLLEGKTYYFIFYYSVVLQPVSKQYAILLVLVTCMIKLYIYVSHKVSTIYDKVN